MTEIIPLNKLYWDKRCGISVFGSEEVLEAYISALEKNIKANGLKIPPKIRKLNDNEKVNWRNKDYLVLQGNHRIEALSRLGKSETLCEIVN